MICLAPTIVPNNIVAFALVATLQYCYTLYRVTAIKSSMPRLSLSNSDKINVYKTLDQQKCATPVAWLAA
jgi:hypothetical protein